MTSLQTDFLGMRFPNPFLLASAPPTRNGEMTRRAFLAGYQAIEGKPGEIVKIDPAKCDGCGLCVMVCPENSLKMAPLIQSSAP